MLVSFCHELVSWKVLLPLKSCREASRLFCVKLTMLCPLADHNYNGQIDRWADDVDFFFF